MSIAPLLRSLLEDDRLDFLSKKYHDFLLKTFEEPSARMVWNLAGRMDPTPNHQYMDWILKMLSAGTLIWPEDADKCKERLGQFHILKRKSRFQGEKDINKYAGFGQLARAVERNSEVKSNREEVNLKATQGLKLIGSASAGEKGVYELYEVTTVEAGLALGWRYTEWCVKDPHYFDRYGPPYYCMLYKVGNEDLGEPIVRVPAKLLHVGSGQLMDKYDVPTTLDGFAECGFDTDRLMNDPKWAWKYAHNLQKRLPEDKEESVILRDLDTAIKYCRSFPSAKELRAKVAHEILTRHANPITQAGHIISYTETLGNGRWKEAEPTLLRNLKFERVGPHLLVSYLRRSGSVLDGNNAAWPEAEPIIAKDSSVSIEYAIYCLDRKRFPLAEPTIIREAIEDNDTKFCSYMQQVMGGKRWPELEEAIKAADAQKTLGAYIAWGGLSPSVIDTVKAECGWKGRYGT